MPSRLLSYFASVKARDPAARSRFEVILYPGAWAVAFHRLAHPLYRARLFFAARVVNHLSRFLTAIDIHPGAAIGRNLFVDHGFVVIGETAAIGDHVTIYSGVTLGGVDPTGSGAVKRHPTIGDNVVIGSGAQILGAIEISANARVGANAVVTKHVATGITVAGIPARPIGEAGTSGDRAHAQSKDDQAQAEEDADFTQKLALLRREISRLSDALSELEASAGTGQSLKRGKRTAGPDMKE